MRFAHFIRVLIGAFTVAFGWVASAQQLAGPITFYYSPNASAHQPIVEAIDSATSSINMAMYHLSDPAVASALGRAAGRRVHVRILFDGGEWKNPADSALVDSLTAAGVTVRKASPFFSITHEKSMTLDGQVAMIGTMNIITKYMDMLDFGVFTSDAGVIREWNQVFEADWQNAATGGGVTPALSNPILVWSPVNSADRLIGLINSAQTSIVLFVENFGYTDLVTALGNAAKRGVAVRTLTPLCNIGSPGFNQPFNATLRANGVDARMVPGPAAPDLPYIHAKSIVVDGSVIYLGSENFSFNSLTKAREVGIVTATVDLAKGVTSLFEQVWPKAQLPPDTSSYNCSAFGSAPAMTATLRLPKIFDLAQ